MSKMQTIQPMVPVIRRPAFWTFLTSLTAFFSVYFLENRMDLNLLLTVIQALLALIGIAAGFRSAWHAYRNYIATKAGLED